MTVKVRYMYINTLLHSYMHFTVRVDSFLIFADFLMSETLTHITHTGIYGYALLLILKFLIVTAVKNHTSMHRCNYLPIFKS